MVYNKIINTDFDTIKSQFTRTIKTLDMHTGGEPLRVVLEGSPNIKAHSVLDYRNQMKQNHDDFRQKIMFEPRGHADMYGLMLLPPERENSDFGVLFLHNEGYSTMCGHATIAIAKLAVILNWVEKVEPVTTMKIDAPCGQLIAYVNVKNGEIKQVYFDNVPSFVVGLNKLVKLPNGQVLKYDLAYGGAFYAYVNAKDVGLELTPNNYRKLIDKGMEIKHAVMAQQAIEHPFEQDLSFLYGTIFIDDSPNPNYQSRNVCIFADGEVDRSATGSGVSGRAAIHYARNEIQQGEIVEIESITGSTMTVSVQSIVQYGDYSAIIPRVSGNAWVHGFSEFTFDDSDIFENGFFLR
jgi:trans-L-3-hydroxyproline dehydratase